MKVYRFRFIDKGGVDCITTVNANCIDDAVEILKRDYGAVKIIWG